MIAFAAGDPLYEVYGNFAIFLTWIFSSLPILLLAALIYLGFLVLRNKDHKKLFMISYLILIILILIDLFSLTYLATHINPEWLEIIASIFTLLAFGLFAALSLQIYKISRHPNKKWFRNLWFLIICLFAGIVLIVLIPALIETG